MHLIHITAFQVVQLTLHVVDVLIDLLHSLAVPHDLILVNLGNKSKAHGFQSDQYLFGLIPFTEASLREKRLFFEISSVSEPHLLQTLLLVCGSI